MRTRSRFMPTLIALLGLTFAQNVWAGLFDQIIEKGKEAVKKETQKEVNKEIDKILGPGQEPQRGNPPPSSQRPGSSQSQSEDLAGRVVGPPKLKKALGLPILSVDLSGAVLTKSEERELRKFFDYVDLGVAPEVFEKHAACFVAEYLPPSEWPKYLEPDSTGQFRDTGMDLFKTEGDATSGKVHSKSGVDWKGESEFDRRRSRQAFVNDYREKFMASAVKLPIELVVVHQARLPEYDFDQKAFIFQEGDHSTTNFLTSGLYVQDLLEKMKLCGGTAPRSSFRLNAPSRWPIAPDDAEQVLKRNPSRQPFFAMVIEVREMPGAKADSPEQSTSTRYVGLPQRHITVKSQALYEDADLTRLLHSFGGTKGPSAAAASLPAGDTARSAQGSQPVQVQGVGDTPRAMEGPRESVLMAGIPETIPGWKQVILNNETLMLLLLKHQGNKFGEKTWEFLAREHLKHDAEYYEGERHDNNMEGKGLEWGMKWDPRSDGGYHPTYIPFTPPGFQGDLTSPSGLNTETMQRFKAWTMKRASGLSDTLLLTGYFTRHRNQQTKQFEPFFHIGDYGKTEQFARLKKFSSPELQKYSPEQMYVTFVNLGEGFPKDVGIVFPAETTTYVPRPSSSDIVRLFGDGSSTSSPPMLRTELEVKVVKFEVIPPVKQTGSLRQHEPEFLFHVRSSNVKVFAKGDKEVVYQQDYSGAVSSTASFSPEPAVQRSAESVPAQSASDGAVPFTADVADLLVAKFLPDSLDTLSLERMMVAQWFDENKSRHRPAASFFPRGTPKPDKAQRAALLDNFKKWIVDRSNTQPTRITIGVYLSHDPRDRNRMRFSPGIVTNVGEIQAGKSGGIDKFGPRSICGFALTAMVHERGRGLRDEYCDGLREAAAWLGVQDRGGQPSWSFRDILVLDHGIAIPDAHPELRSMRASSEYRLSLELEVTGVTRETEQAMQVRDPVPSKMKGRHKMKTQDSGSNEPYYFLFASRVVKAQAIPSDRERHPDLVVVDLQLQ